MPFTFKLSKRLALMKASLVPAAAAALTSCRLQDRQVLAGPTVPSTRGGAGCHTSPSHHSRTLADSAARRLGPNQACHDLDLKHARGSRLLARPRCRGPLLGGASGERHAPRLSVRRGPGAPRAARSVVRVRANPPITPSLGDDVPLDQYMWADSLTVATSKP
jgi:hypothetical protein